jgi:hypothetical protein
VKILGIDPGSRLTGYGIIDFFPSGYRYVTSGTLKITGDNFPQKLKQILNLMVKFLTTHCHPFHGLPPVPTSFSGVDVTQIEAEFQLYDSKVLNQKIRIN